MNDSDRQLRDAIRNLYVAQTQLESVQRSAGYKIVCRARQAFEFLVPAAGRLGVINRAVRRALNIWLDEGPARVLSRSIFKLGRVTRAWLGFGTEDREARAAAERGELARSIVSHAAAARPRRPQSEIAHLIGQHCQKCRSFRGSSCMRLTGEATDTPAAQFYKTLANPSAGCPAGAWSSAESPPISRLNLVYHVTPIQHPENIWQWNVGQLLKRIDQFNGRRIITVVTPSAGRAMDPPEAVVDAFRGHAVEFRFAPNDTKLREASHFLPALRELASTNAAEAIFYSHCKGVSHLNQSAVRPWTEAMYHHNLDRIEEIRQLLRRWPCVGIAKRYGHFENLSLGTTGQKGTFRKRRWHGWHFAGTFWWARHDRLFSQPDWDRIPLHPYAVEAFLANFFESKDALCLAYDGIPDPYNPQVWQDAA